MTDKHLSKFLSLVLRHKPEVIGLQLDSQGWAVVADLIDRFRESGKNIDLERLQNIVATDNKKRYTLDLIQGRIRANQGHSINVNLGLAPQTPPPLLYHGTARRNLDSIFENGLQKGSRQHVHLSSDMATARQVGQRHGKPVILMVDCTAMVQAGHSFFLSENKVWLTEHVPAAFLRQS
jgi:putative RNA 2'-phosphotransferase